jgi:hypothetical protein
MSDISKSFTMTDLMGWTGYYTFSDSLHRYLKLKGWEEQSPGIGGTFWYAPNIPGEENALIVPARVDPGSFEWNSVIRRLAYFEKRPPGEIVASIATQYVDVTRLRADGDDIVRSIPLEVGVRLVTSARTMLRSVGTTARRPRAAIDGNYSPFGDSIISGARMGHTEEGSYIVPILMPLPTPQSDDTEDEAFVGMEIEHMPIESSERRIMRMLAQSMAAANELIVRPDRSPRKPADLLPFITAGGSRELLSAMHAILSEPSVTQLETTFSWAGGVGSPGGVATTVTIEEEAASRLDQAARLLHPSERFPGQLYTGQIVAIMHRPGADDGDIEIDTVRSSRRCRLRVHLRGEAFSNTYIWAHDERAVLVEGEVQRVGRRLTIEDPRRIGPLDEMFTTPLNGGGQI